MTMMATHQIECTHCGNQQETMVWKTVNVSLDPELKDRLLKGEINLFVCEKCGAKMFVDVPLQYHDMEQQYCIHYYPTHFLDDETFYGLFTKQGAISLPLPPAIAKSGAYLLSPHIVFDMDEMIKYVMFREKLKTQTT